MKATKNFRHFWLGLLIIGVSGLIVGISVYSSNLQRAATQDTIASTDNSEITSVLGSETAVDGPYNVTASRRTDLDTQEEVAISVRIQNVGTSRLEFSPGLQLKLLSDATLVPISPKTTVSLPGGPLEPGDVQEGIAYFATGLAAPNIAFFPDIKSTSFVSIPID